MTENESIDVLQYLLGHENAVDKGTLDATNCLNSQEKEALKLILEEIQQYRAMEQKLKSVYGEHNGLLEIIVNGLVGYENVPDKSAKALLLTDDDADRWEEYKTIGTPAQIYTKIGTYATELSKYAEIGTVEECRTAVERMKPRTPKESKMWNLMLCPNCGNNVTVKEKTVFRLKYCCNCGQAIDWSE